MREVALAGDIAPELTLFDVSERTSAPGYDKGSVPSPHGVVRQQLVFRRRHLSAAEQIPIIEIPLQEWPGRTNAGIGLEFLWEIRSPL
jgi:hypothetical protein